MTVTKNNTQALASFYGYLSEVFKYLSQHGYCEFYDYGTNFHDGLMFYFNPKAFEILNKAKPICWYNLTLHPLAVNKKDEYPGGLIGRSIVLNIEEMQLEES